MGVTERPVRLLQPYQSGLALLAAGILVASCATVEQPLGPIGDAAKGDGQAKLAATQDGQPTDIDCPVVTVRSGASAWQIPTGPATNVRYQGSIGQLVRECAVLGQTMTMRVGVEGRLLVGPEGGPGKVDVPVRMALVAEGPQPKPIWSKFYSVAVEVPPNASQSVFSIVEDDLTFALPADRRSVDNYVVYVGFDPQGAATAAKPKPKPKPATVRREASPPTTAATPQTAPAARAPAPAPSQAPARQQPQFEPPPNVFAPPPGHTK
jgi:hypothetical protein